MMNLLTCWSAPVSKSEEKQRYIPKVDECDNTEGVVTPLVGAVDEGADQAGDDNDDRQEEGRHDVRQRQASGDQQAEEDGGEVDEPLDIPNIL